MKSIIMKCEEKGTPKGKKEEEGEEKYEEKKKGSWQRKQKGKKKEPLEQFIRSIPIARKISLLHRQIPVSTLSSLMWMWV